MENNTELLQKIWFLWTALDYDDYAVPEELTIEQYAQMVDLEEAESILNCAIMRSFNRKEA